MTSRPKSPRIFSAGKYIMLIAPERSKAQRHLRKNGPHEPLSKRGEREREGRQSSAHKGPPAMTTSTIATRRRGTKTEPTSTRGGPRNSRIVSINGLRLPRKRQFLKSCLIEKPHVGWRSARPNRSSDNGGVKSEWAFLAARLVCGGKAKVTSTAKIPGSFCRSDAVIDHRDPPCRVRGGRASRKCSFCR